MNILKIKRVKLSIKMFFRKIKHRWIVNYLISCSGAFHHGKYGIEGWYVVLMSDEKYHKYNEL